MRPTQHLYAGTLVPATNPTRLPRGLLLSLLLLLASSVLAQPADSNAALLDRVAQNAGQVGSVFTRFVQERHLSLFQEPLRSEGCLCFQKPGRLRWEITQPYRSILVSDGHGAAQFERLNDHWKKLDLGLADAMQHILVQIGDILEGRYAASQHDYAASATNSPDGPVVTLTPQNPAVRKMMQAIEIHLAPDFRVTRRVVLRELDGDYTEIRFSEQQADPPFPAGTFDRSQPVELDQILRAVPRPKPAPAKEAGAR